MALSPTGRKIMGVVNIAIGLGVGLLPIVASDEFERQLKSPWIAYVICAGVALGFITLGILALMGISMGERR